MRPIDARAAVLRRAADDRRHRQRGRPLAVISDDDTHVKKIIFSPQLLAKAVFADPELTLDLPPAITAATGMDALTHNVESVPVARVPPDLRRHRARGRAHRGARLADRGARAAATSQARGDMLMSSMMGAIAFQKDLGAVHSCAHALGTVARPAPRPGQRHHDRPRAALQPAGRAREVRRARARRGVRREHGRRARAGFLAWLAQLKADDRHPGALSDRAARRVTTPTSRRLVEIAVADICHQTNPRQCTRGRLRSASSRRRCEARACQPAAQVGISACFFTPTRQAGAIFNGKTLQYVEQSVAHWVMSRRRARGDDPGDRKRGTHQRSDMHARSLRRPLDGLVLQGGADVCAAEATASSRCEPSGAGDRIRDEYEIELLRAFVARQAGARHLPRRCR